MAEPPSDDAGPSLRTFVSALGLLGALGLLVLVWAAQTIPRQYPPELLELRAYNLELAERLRRGEINGIQLHLLLRERARLVRERLGWPPRGTRPPEGRDEGAAPDRLTPPRPGRAS